jgi:hypothetical protein
MRRGGYVNICRGLQCHTPVEEAETAAKRSGREQFGVKRWARYPHKEEPTRGVSFLPKLRTVSFRWYALGARFQELHPGLVAMGHQMRSDLLPRKEDHQLTMTESQTHPLVLFGILIKRLIHLHFVGNWRLLIIPSAPLKLEASPN